eukprot:Rhum_TRINITY_DN13597_c2_g1::Rhum_TRINITY_DN13597_c2_g1_i1::g.61636::m.61636
MSLERMCRRFTSDFSMFVPRLLSFSFISKSLIACWKRSSRTCVFLMYSCSLAFSSPSFSSLALPSMISCCRPFPHLRSSCSLCAASFSFASCAATSAFSLCSRTAASFTCCSSAALCFRSASSRCLASFSASSSFCTRSSAARSRAAVARSRASASSTFTCAAASRAAHSLSFAASSRPCFWRSDCTSATPRSCSARTSPSSAPILCCSGAMAPVTRAATHGARKARDVSHSFGSSSGAGDRSALLAGSRRTVSSSSKERSFDAWSSPMPRKRTFSKSCGDLCHQKRPNLFFWNTCPHGTRLSTASPMSDTSPQPSASGTRRSSFVYALTGCAMLLQMPTHSEERFSASIGSTPKNSIHSLFATGNGFVQRKGFVSGQGFFRKCSKGAHGTWKDHSADEWPSGSTRRCRSASFALPAFCSCLRAATRGSDMSRPRGDLCSSRNCSIVAEARVQTVWVGWGGVGCARSMKYRYCSFY